MWRQGGEVILQGYDEFCLGNLEQQGVVKHDDAGKLNDNNRACKHHK